MRMTIEELFEQWRTLLAGGELVTVPGVEILQVGTHRAVTGEVTVTHEDLLSAVAAYEDPDIGPAPIKLGHFDQRPGFALAKDGEPALGWLENLRIQGDKLLADLKGVPKAFADRMASMYRNRSVEMSAGRNSKGKVYPTAIKALALLGVTEPAIKSLADIMALSGPATDEDRREVVVLDPTDALMALSRLMSGVETPPIPARTPHLRNDEGVPGSSRGGPGMSLTEDRIRELLGVEANVDLEAELAKLKESASGSGGDGGNTDPPKTGTDDDDEGGEGAKPNQPPTGDPASAGMVQISQKVLDELIQNAGLGAQAAETLADQERERELVALASRGIVQPAEMESLRELLKVSPEATRKMLSARAPSFSTIALGSDGASGGTDQGLDAAFAEVEANYFKGFEPAGGN